MSKENQTPNGAKGKDKPIGDMAKTVAFFGLNIAEGQLSKRIDDPEIRKGIETVFPLIRKVIAELNDDNPDNKQQLKETLAAWTNGPLADYLETILDELTEKLDKEEERELVFFIGRAVINLLRIITDLNPANVEQIRAAYNSPEFLRSAKDVVLDNVVFPALDKKGISPEVRNLINVIFIELFEFLIKRRAG